MGKQWPTKHYTERLGTRNPIKTLGWTWCSGMVSSSRSNMCTGYQTMNWIHNVINNTHWLCQIITRQKCALYLQAQILNWPKHVTLIFFQEFIHITLGKYLIHVYFIKGMIFLIFILIPFCKCLFYIRYDFSIYSCITYFVNILFLLILY